MSTPLPVKHPLVADYALPQAVAQRQADALNSLVRGAWRYSIEQRPDGRWRVFPYWTDPAFYHAQPYLSGEVET